MISCESIPLVDTRHDANFLCSLITGHQSKVYLHYLKI